MASVVENAVRSVVTPIIMGIANIRRPWLKTPPGGNPYLHGIHTPLTEEYDLTQLKVHGTIPRELDGEYIRIGPNPMEIKNEGAYHWFVGDGMVHGVCLQGGAAKWYRNRWIRSTEVSLKLNEKPKPGVRNPAFDNPNTNVLEHAGKIWALVEAGGHPVELTPTLDTREHNPFSGTLKSAFSAHPHRDPASGELHAICYEASDPNLLSYVVVGVDGKVRRTTPIQVNNGPSVHDCMITENYVVVMDLPVTFSMQLLLSGARFPYRWNDEHEARIGLLPREGRAEDVIWCPIDPCYIFHVANAFEQEGSVVMDAVVHTDMFNSDQFFGPDGSNSEFERLVININERSITRNVISADNQEFPRIDERRTSRPYRYAYSVATGNPTTAEVSDTRLFKHDLKSGTQQVHDFGEGHVLGEFVFVPESDDAREDQGWLMGYVVDPNNNQTKLAIIRADDFEAEPRAVIIIPHRIPPGFHGNWVAANSLAETIL